MVRCGPTRDDLERRGAMWNDEDERVTMGDDVGRLGAIWRDPDKCREMFIRTEQ